MRILFIGDVVGKSGMDAIREHLPEAISDWRIDLTIVNGENAASAGFGITQAIYNDLLAAGADVVTLGNHSWAQKEALEFIDRAPRLIRPINYLFCAPGHGAAFIETKGRPTRNGHQCTGRLFMEPVEDPFVRSIGSLRGIGWDRRLTRSSSISTAKRRASSRWTFLRRPRQSCGRHAYPYAEHDHRILPRGTAYISDAGMTGDYEFNCWDAERRTVAALHDWNSEGALRSSDRASDNEWRRGRDRRRHWPCC